MYSMIRADVEAKIYLIGIGKILLSHLKQTTCCRQGMPSHRLRRKPFVTTGKAMPEVFSGVAVEKLPDRLVLTTQMQAGWYRYIQKWTFYLDGTIEPRFGFSAVTSPCTSKPHNHHAYWRFDFDINGFPSDLIQEFNTPPPLWHNKNLK